MARKMRGQEAEPMKIDSKLQPWIDARTRHRLSHAHVQMARELAMNPTNLGKLDNHRQEPWKLPLPESYILQGQLSRSTQTFHFGSEPGHD